MTSRRAGLTIFLVVVAALASYGVLTTPESRPLAEIGVASQFVCALPYDVSGYVSPPAPQRPVRGTVPDTFEPAFAVVCDTALQKHLDADGTATYFERIYSGDFSATIEDLNSPHSRPSIFDTYCAASSLAAMPIDVWLVDSNGRAIQPSYPRGECGLDNTRGLFQIQSLPEVDVVEHRVLLDAGGISSSMFCSPTMTTPTPGPQSMLDVQLSPSGFCRFDTTSAAPVFLGADRFESEESVDWNAALADREPADLCGTPARSVATSTTYTQIRGESVAIEVHIELDGCRRILADGFVPLPAPAAFIESIRENTR